MSKILAVDASPLIYATYNSIGHLTTRKGEPTGLRYGFVRAVRSYQEKLKADAVIIAFDSSGGASKAEGHATYKANRVFTPEKATMYQQVPALREMLTLTKWAQIDSPGFEADDLLGAVARSQEKKGNQTTIVSPDNDLLQLVNDSTTVFRPGSTKKKTKDKLLREGDVLELLGVYPESLCLLRAVTGDVSDNLKGSLPGAPVERELRVALSRCSRRATPYDPDDLLAILWAVPTTVPETSVLQPLREKSVREHTWENFRLMSLHTPTTANLQRGQRDRLGLEKLFQRLEFNSMFKYVDELTGGAPRGAKPKEEDAARSQLV